jgi:hypothetical protein
MKKDFLKRWTAIMIAITVTLGAITGVYALVVKPNLDNVIKEQIEICKVKTDKENDLEHSKIYSQLEEIRKRAMKAEIYGWVKLNKNERAEVSELYKVLGGK